METWKKWGISIIVIIILFAVGKFIWPVVKFALFVILGGAAIYWIYKRFFKQKGG